MNANTEKRTGIVAVIRAGPCEDPAELFDLKRIDLDDIETYTDIIGCDLFDIARVSVGGVLYDVYVDDEGLLKDSPVPTAAYTDGQVKLVGTLVITKGDDESGDTNGLSVEDIDNITDCISAYRTRDGRRQAVLVLDLPAMWRD